MSRKVTGDKGESFMQNVTVFASSPHHARTIVNDQFARLRLVSKSKEAAYQAAAAVRHREGLTGRAQDDHRGGHRLVVDLAGKTAQALARRSSRRQFFKFLGAGSLGAGLWLTRTDVSLGAIAGCVGCGGGPCNPCYSPASLCDQVSRRRSTRARRCPQGGGCPEGCTTSGEWFCCLTSGRRRSAASAAPSATARPGATTCLPLLHEPRHPLHAEAALGRPALRLPAARGAGLS